jgi:hypothetical protein
MSGCPCRALGILVILLFAPPVRSLSPAEQQEDSESTFTRLLRSAVELSPDPCGPPYGREADTHSTPLESRVFDVAAAMITTTLNAEAYSHRSPKERAVELLRTLEAVSAQVNSAWPEESRFHFEVLDLSPALVVKTSIRARQTFFVFGVAEEDGKGIGNARWRLVGSRTDDADRPAPVSLLDLYAIQRGPSGRARFLARFTQTGCAGPFGVSYDVREWEPTGIGALSEIIQQGGAFGLDDRVPGFAWIGRLQTQGPLMTLPYCVFSAIDTWHNPSLCAVDTYNVSGDEIRFESRRYNRPELVPVAKAIEHAQRRDYPAVLGYCASNDIARKLVRSLPPSVFADELRVTRKPGGVKRVELGYEPTFSFDVERRGGRWLVIAFDTK